MLLWAFSHSFVSCTSLDSWIVLFSMGMRGLVIFVPFLILFYPLKTIESDFNLTFIALSLTQLPPPPLIPSPFLLPPTHTHSFAWYAMKFIVSNECATNISGPYTAQKKWSRTNRKYFTCFSHWAWFIVAMYIAAKHISPNWFTCSIDSMAQFFYQIRLVDRCYLPAFIVHSPPSNPARKQSASIKMMFWL